MGQEQSSLIVANSSRDVEEDLHYRPQAHHAKPHGPTVLGQLEDCPFRHLEISACRLLCVSLEDFMDVEKTDVVTCP